MIGKNVVLWKFINQFIIYFVNEISFILDKVVDGNGDGNWNSYICIYILFDSDNFIWNVNFGNVYYIIVIKIKNRNDNCEYLF